MQVLSQCLTMCSKIPRLPFDKFIHAKRTSDNTDESNWRSYEYLNNFEGALMKAIRS